MSSGQKALYYILSFCIPVVGIILGIIWLNEKEDKAKNGVGKVCLILGIVAVVIQCICGFMFGFIGAIMDSSTGYYNNY